MSNSPSLPPRWLWFLALTACEAAPQEGSGDTAVDATTDAPSLSTTCEQIGCPEGPPPVCDAERAASFVTTQVCEDRGDGPKCHPRTDTVACEPERTHLCLERECREAPRDVCGWTASERTSIFKTFAFADMGEVIDPTTMERSDSCCRDFDGDGTLDSGWSDSLRTLEPLVGNVNAALAENIVQGHGLLVFDVYDLDIAPGVPHTAPIDDPYVELVGYFAVYAGGSPGKAADGTSEFHVQNTSFRRGTWRPVLSAVGSIEGGRFRSLSATGAILFRGGSFYLELPLNDLEIEGDVTVADNGGLVFSGPHPLGATLSAYIDRADLLHAINLDVSDSCTCRSAAEDGAPLDPARGACHPPADPSCIDPIDFCAVLHSSLCDPFIQSFPPDFDADGDGRKESFTLGMFFETAPTRFVARTDCAAAQ